MRYPKSARGFTLVELLVASLVFAVTIAGALSVWAAATTSIVRTSEEVICAQLARTDIEKAKATGFDNLSTGALSGGTGTYTGTTTNSTYVSEFYTQAGAFVSYGTSLLSAPPSSAYYKLVRVTSDTNVAKGAGTSYKVTTESTRTIVTTVARVSDNTVMYTMGTVLVKAGI